MGFLVTGTEVGAGVMSLKGLLAALAEAGKDVNVILGTWPPFLGTVEQSIDLEEEWAKNGIKYMKVIQAKKMKK